jgi:sulfate permease, SulP family
VVREADAAGEAAAEALAGVLVLGVLQGLVVTVVLALVYVVARIRRPEMAALARDPATGAWGRADRHPDWELPEGVLFVRSDGLLLYPNANAVQDRVQALVTAASPRAVVIDLAQSTELDVQTVDMLGELAVSLRRDGIELRLANVRVPALQVLERSGVAARVRVEPTLDAAYETAVTDPAR